MVVNQKRRLRRNKRLEPTAYHEAGHAVAAFFHSVGLKWVSIVPRDGSLGHVRHNPLFRTNAPDWDDSNRTRNRLETLVFVCLAGTEAQRRFAPRSVRHW